ncbi:hypothetical protein [Deinococcus peraridilitoris]|uniref:hypothetical protein n=1 Tax=Deinococcus peraridilitoris TaxID=432329 RepID=UPI003CCC3051
MTMAQFIAGLAFSSDAPLSAAKLGILGASVVLGRGLCGGKRDVAERRVGWSLGWP